MDEMEDKVEELIGRAVSADDATEAMKFAQAALNAAQAINTMVATRTMEPSRVTV